MSPALVASDRSLLRRLPKAELHCHLDGSVRPETMLELAKEYRVAMPRDDADALREFMRVDDARNLEDYLMRFDTTLSVMQTGEALERMAYELAIDVAAEGVRYIEMRYAPPLNTLQGLTLEQAVEAPLRGIAKAQREADVTARVIVCSLRHYDPALSLQLAQLAVAYKDRGVVGFDLAGGELGNPASRHAAAFDYCTEHGLACTCHAGEGDGPESVRQAVHDCRAHRIGHATRLIEDAALLEEVHERGIALELCLTSNVQTRATDRYETHPLKQYLARGMNVCLNTDNRLMSGTTLVDEYHHAATHCDCTFDELAGMALDGFRSSFLPDDEKRLMVAAMEQEIADIRAGVTP
ncbi:MAG TPA: adenosine deaminase [Gemmatimonadaceae bacterium]|nr:adenosine deaminase [Gemmatimonadaceae bacterium]